MKSRLSSKEKVWLRFTLEDVRTSEIETRISHDKSHAKASPEYIGQGHQHTAGRLMALESLV